jgi:hypothetical protein
MASQNAQLLRYASFVSIQRTKSTPHRYELTCLEFGPFFFAIIFFKKLNGFIWKQLFLIYF